MENPLSSASNRRFLALIAGLIAGVGNKKLGLDLTPAEVTELLLFLGTYIVASNGKEALVKKANAAGQVAADAVIPGPDTDAKLNELAKGPPQ